MYILFVGVECRYLAHVENVGDTQWVPNGGFVGTRGQSRRLEVYSLFKQGLISLIDLIIRELQ